MLYMLKDKQEDFYSILRFQVPGIPEADCISTNDVFE